MRNLAVSDRQFDHMDVCMYVCMYGRSGGVYEAVFIDHWELHLDPYIASWAKSPVISIMA